MQNFIERVEIGGRFGVEVVGFRDGRFVKEVGRVRAREGFDGDRHVYYFLCVRRKIMGKW